MPTNNDTVVDFADSQVLILILWYITVAVGLKGMDAYEFCIEVTANSSTFYLTWNFEYSLLLHIL